MMRSGMPLDAAPDLLTLASVLAVFRRRRGVLLGSIGVLLGLAILGSLLATPRFRATAQVQVQKEKGAAFGLESTVTGEESTGASGDSLDYNMTLQTEAAILRSPALAIAVIQAARLEPTADYFPVHPPAKLSSSLGAWFPWSLMGKPLEAATIPLDQAPNRRAASERIFKSHLKVLPLAGTRIIEVSYSDPDPARAALVANTITRILTEFSFEQHFTATMQGSTWLSGQLDELRTRAEQATAKAAALERGTGMFGTDASRNIVLERLDSLNQTLTAAESNRILKEGIDRVAASASPELISSLSGNASTGAVAPVNNSLSLLQGLRQQQATVQAELAEDSVRYGAMYPRVLELKAQLAGVNHSIAEETARLGQRAHTDWLVALRAEQGARAAFEQQKRIATRQNDTVIAYQLARQEAGSSRDLYESMLAKLQQARLLEGLRASNISIVSPAEVPATNHPASPNGPMWIGAGLAAGLLLGCALAVLAELMDGSIHSFTRLEATLGVGLLAALPSAASMTAWSGEGWLSALFRRTRRLVSRRGHAAALRLQPSRVPVGLHVLDEPRSPFTESVRSLRTELLLARGDASSRVLLITSPLPDDGKSFVSANLAALLAQGGARVLLVDADLRRPALDLRGRPSTEPGLAGALARKESAADPQLHALSVVQPFGELPGLRRMPSGEIPRFPLELLGSPRLTGLLEEWKQLYDFIVLDAPPVLAVSDALLLAQHSDAVLLVARHRHTPLRALTRTVESLRNPHLSRCPVAVVLNDVAQTSGAFEEHFGFGRRRYASYGT